MMKRWLLLSLVTLVLSGCTKPGSFCVVYKPVTMNEKAARSLVAEDRAAAETIATNNAVWEGC